MSTGDCILEVGANSWLNLPNTILSAQGKELVTRDSDLTDATLNALRALEPTSPDQFGPYFFSDDDNDKSSDIGMATLSMCIRENLHATMAEIVARYADLRRIPYAHVATVLTEMRRTTGFTMFVRNRTDNTFQAVPWSPEVIPADMSMLPPKKRKSV